MLGCICVCGGWGGGGRGNLAEPDPYTGGEGLVTCYTQSCAAEMQCMAHACLSFFLMGMR